MADCIFCKIANGEVKADVIYDDGDFVVFRDIAPRYKVHVLIVPKKHIESVNDVTGEDEKIFARLFTVAKNVAKNLGVAESGYRLVVNTNEDAGQEVRHIHVHLLGGEKLRGL